jgi:NAD(P)-dependent dehydrogenase (short-subunit alcohol dehydrogenase family)
MDDTLFSVAGQVVLVSGGSRGIGRAIAEGFAQRGAHVIITGRQRESLEQTAQAIGQGRQPVRAIVCDVAKHQDIQSLVRTVLEEFGQIDTLVNVAGVNRRRLALEYSEEDFDFILDINFRGAFFLAQAVGRAMVARKSGSQIHVASLNTDRPLKYVLPYAASKAAMGHMTRSLALEWGPHGVRVNALAPGFTVTDLNRKLWDDEKVLSWVLDHTPQRRLGQPVDMVGTAIFLAAPAAAFITGQILYVDGGMSAGYVWPLAV